MSCSNPIPAVDYGYKLNKDGVRVRNIKLLDMQHKYIHYGLDELKVLFGDDLILLPCGKCYLCALDYSKMWASRIVLESKDHQENCFITLTYDDWNLPEYPSKRHWQLFMKRFRKAVGVPVRFFACGEKGTESGRSHMHAIIFGYDFKDKVFLKRSKSGLIIYRSPLLEQLWPFGISSIGDVSPESAAYVAKYSLKKKMSGVDNGEWVLMSRRPGLAASHFNEEDYITDKLYIEGYKYKIPRYFDKIAEKNNSFPYALTKFERIERAKLITSKKYMFGFNREEEALAFTEEKKILKDCMKVRIGV